MIEFFSILLVAILIYQLAFVNKLKEIKKHDQVLFAFCDYRREIMEYMRKKGFDLYSNEYDQIKQVYDITNDSIHYFNKHKLTTFNLRKLKKIIKKGDRDIETVRIIHSNNSDIRYFQKEFMKTYSKAIINFTPFIKSKILISILKLIIKIHIINSVDKLLSYIQTFQKYANFEDEV